MFEEICGLPAGTAALRRVRKAKLQSRRLTSDVGCASPHGGRVRSPRTPWRDSWCAVRCAAFMLRGSTRGPIGRSWRELGMDLSWRVRNKGGKLVGEPTGRVDETTWEAFSAYLSTAVQAAA